MTAASEGGPRPLPLYLGPTLPRWRPTSVQDVQDAIDDGTLRERHWLDVKAQVGTSDGAKKDLARDLASFANDGGALLVGVREDKPAQTLTVEPVPLDGLSEQIDQVARSRCDPPLYVACHPLPVANGEGPATGVLLVEIPPSPLAPHMTDGRYYGRNDTTNAKLTDGDVARLHAVRTTRQATAEQVIAQEIRRDPVAPEHRTLSHLFVVARPLASPPDLLTPLIESRELSALVTAAPDTVPGSDLPSPNWPGYLHTYGEPRAQGAGFRSYGMPGRRFTPELEDAKENALLDIEIHDDGQTVLFCGRASDTSPRHEGEQHVIDSAVVVLTRTLVTLAGQLGARSGYAGRWLLAVGVTDLAGKYSSGAVNAIVLGRGHSPFSADDYVQGTEAVTVELLDQPGAVTRRLVARLLRALGSDGGPLLVDG